jgi:hypothetical protein
VNLKEERSQNPAHMASSWKLEVENLNLAVVAGIFPESQQRCERVASVCGIVAPTWQIAECFSEYQVHVL